MKNFDQTGSNLTADGSGDDKIKLDKCPEFEFSMRDADRDSKTGLFPAAAPEGPAGGVVEGEEEVVDGFDDESLRRGSLMLKVCGRFELFC